MGIKVDGIEIPLGTPGPGVAKGGTTGQVLTKKTNQNYDTEWKDISVTSEMISDLDSKINANSDEISKADNSIKNIQSSLTYYSNENLLDNWYFVNPINQLNKTTHTGNGIVIDRWRSYSDGLKATLTSSGIILQNLSSTQESSMVYYVALNEFITNTTYTISALLSTNELLSFSVFPLGVSVSSPYDKTGTIRLDTYTSSSVVLAIRLSVKANSTSPDVIAAKLEIGNQQTLCRKNESGHWVLNDTLPNYQLSLFKCQRYLLKLSAYSRQDLMLNGYVTDNARALTLYLPGIYNMRNNLSIVIQGNNSDNLPSVIVRGVNGYSSDAAYPNGYLISNINYFVYFTPSDAHANLIQIELRKKDGTSWLDIPNNTPLCCQFNYADIILNGTF